MSNTIATTSRVGHPSAIETILTAGFIAGCLDLLTAILVYSVAMQRTTDTKLLQGIGRAAFGSNAFDSETSLALSGVAVHFFIAFSFTIFYFFIFRGAVILMFCIGLPISLIVSRYYILKHQP